MRRADRLFQLVQLIRGRRLCTAALLAERLQVSLRTVYRDVADLQLQGVPIDGEAGVGYRMRAGFDLPPLMFTTAEAQALVAAIRLAQPRLDVALAASAETALSKILAVLPAATRAAAERLAVYAPAVGPDAATRARLASLRLATEARQKLQLHYRDLKVSVWARHIELTGAVRHHRMHDERGGDDLQDCADATRALGTRRCPGRLHRPAHGRVVHAAPLRSLVGLSRRAATGAAATPQSGCSTAWAAA